MNSSSSKDNLGPITFATNNPRTSIYTLRDYNLLFPINNKYNKIYYIF